MVELLDVAIALLISLIFAMAEIAVTLYANDKTTEKVMKHIDENFREISDKIAEIKGDKRTNGN